jgi:hypothetical protein
MQQLSTYMWLGLLGIVATLAIVLGSGTRAAVASGPDPAGTMYVSDYLANSIDVFAAGVYGNVPPIRTISGPATGVSGPGDVAVDSAGDVFSSNTTNSVTVYGPGASGNIAPIRTIAGSNTGLCYNDDIALAADGTLFVSNSSCGGSVEVFAPGASGNVAPLRVISGPLTGLGTLVDGVGVDATGTLYAANTLGNSIQVFAPGANGNVAPVRSISGLLTGLSAPNDVHVGFGGDLYVTNGGCGFVPGGVCSIEVFAPGANGNVAPVRSISGPLTGFNQLDDFAVDAGGTAYVTNFHAPFSVRVFGPAQSGNVAPQDKIEGLATTFQEPEGVDIAPVAAPTLTTTTSPSVGLGGATHDTATLTGTNPTGLIIFKLFGPGDPTCSGAPAFISPVQTVNGNGIYTSPAFVPTAVGNYSWVAFYSGDTNNAPVATACADPAETLTVSAAVGGVAALSVSNSGSSLPWTPLAAVAASVMAALAAGVWYSRRRWLG